MKTFAIVLALAAALPAAAATREELKREREAIEADYARRAEACKTQFVVTPCLDTVRVDKQKALSHVTAQENALDAQARQAKADARRQRLADKAAAAEAPASAAFTARAASAPRNASKAPKAHQKPPESAERSAREQAKRADFDARQREIEEHRKKVEERNAERARKKPAAKPLPPPASAGSS